MATVTFTYDHSRDPMHPGDLADKIAAALTLANPPTVDISPTQIIATHPNVTSANTAAIQTVINAYVLDPTWASGPPGVLASRAQAALAANATYLALASPSVAQNTAQLQRVTKECNALIRLALNLLDTTSGT